MGEWGWVFVGYVAMTGSLGAYSLWLHKRLSDARRRARGSS